MCSEFHQGEEREPPPLAEKILNSISICFSSATRGDSIRPDQVFILKAGEQGCPLLPTYSPPMKFLGSCTSEYHRVVTLRLTPQSFTSGGR